MGNPFKNVAKIQYANAISVILIIPVYYIFDSIIEFDPFITIFLCLLIYVIFSSFLAVFVSKS
jgi:hypothetical protein